MAQETPRPASTEITIFETEDGRTRVEVRFQNENVWLTQKLMAELYECSTDNISLHLRNIYAENELERESTTEESSVVQKDQVVDMYLDHAEFQASRNRAMRMVDWAAKLDAFLQFNEQEILQDKGRVSHAVALALAEKEFAEFRVRQDREYESDFDRLLKQLPQSSSKSKRSKSK